MFVLLDFVRSDKKTTQAAKKAAAKSDLGAKKGPHVDSDDDEDEGRVQVQLRRRREERDTATSQQGDEEPLLKGCVYKRR